MKIKVEILASSIAAKIPFDIETAVWVAGIGDELAAKLSKVGLVAPRRIKGSLSELLSMYRDEREAGNKPGTRTNHRTITNDLVRYFPATLDPGTLKAVHAKAFLAHLRERGLASCTVARRIRRVQSIFAYAVKVGWLPICVKQVLQNPVQLPAGPSSQTPHNSRRLSAKTALQNPVQSTCKKRCSRGPPGMDRK